jgi:redox-sensing transcriptional repressor
MNLSENRRKGGMPGPPVPEPSLRRLPQYYHFLVDLQSRGVKVVSCSAIGVALQLVPVQVRKDLQFPGIIGKPKVGYPVDALVAAIEALLGWNNANAAFLVGAGNLGTAILGYERFSRFGLQVVAAFDNDPGKIGHLVHGKPVLSLATLAECAQRMNVHMGVITTPSEVAQAVADQMVKADIQAIWNFAPVKLKVPAQVIVRNEDLYSSWASLSCQLARRLLVPIEVKNSVGHTAPEKELRTDSRSLPRKQSRKLPRRKPRSTPADLATKDAN